MPNSIRVSSREECSMKTAPFPFGIHRLHLCSAWLALWSSLLASPAVDAAEKPNILIIFTDDQGYADIGCYGNTKNKTPRLDQLAREGTRFTSFYSQTVCGPSRSALLTGRYPIRSKGWGMPASEITFAELIRRKRDGF